MNPDHAAGDDQFAVEEHAIAIHRHALQERFPLPPLKKRKSRRLALAGCAFCLLAATLVWLDPAYRSEQFTTAIGEQRQVRLADGSHVSLNTDTAMRISWHLRSRNVELQRGQALFDVASERWRPFQVHAAHTRVHVLGTRFEVWRHADAVHVTVLRGRVKVSGKGGNTELGPGQQIVAHADAFTPVSLVDIARLSAWQNGKLVFYRVHLRDALQEIQRYSRHTIRLDDLALGDLLVSGVFDATHAEAVLDLLPTILPVTILRDTSGTIHIAAR